MNLIRVLIVDDDPVIRRLIQRYGAELGWECWEAASSREAIDRLGRLDFNFALIDVNLGADDGIQLAAHIRERYPKITVINMSGDPANHDRVREAGLGQLLSKPFTINEIRLAMSKKDQSAG